MSRPAVRAFKAHVAFALAAAVTVLAASPALAHTQGVAGAGLGAGVLHPFAGIDHVLAMLAVGLFAWQRGARARWIVPAAFVVMVAAGAVAGANGGAYPVVELGVIGSLLVLGALVAVALRLPVGAAASIVGLFAVFHGHAHGAEMAAAASPVLFGLGFLAATAALHGLGLAMGYLCRHGRWPRLVRAAGAAVAVSGAVLLAAV